MHSFIDGIRGAFRRPRKITLEMRINSIGMDRASFAEYCGVSKSCVDKWISGTHKFNPIANRVLMMLENGYED